VRRHSWALTDLVHWTKPRSSSFPNRTAHSPTDSRASTLLATPYLHPCAHMLAAPLRRP
jgi:hypothetical protein